MLPSHSPVVAHSQPTLVHIKNPLSSVELCQQVLGELLPQHEALGAIPLGGNPFYFPVLDALRVIENLAYLQGCNFDLLVVEEVITDVLSP